eukprot:scaffold1399_cov410-Prasinococcus_capsulatus_cf.AAC.43
MVSRPTGGRAYEPAAPQTPLGSLARSVRECRGPVTALAHEDRSPHPSTHVRLPAALGVLSLSG